MRVDSVKFAGTVMDPDGPLPADLPQIAFSGRSNVGKSSLINTLLGRTRKKVARVSATPGKTQGLNFIEINDRFFLVDLPGFGYARVPERVRSGWKRLVERYLGRPDGPVGVAHLIDARRGAMVSDLGMLDYLSGLALPTLVVVTKIDKLNREGRKRIVPNLIHSTGLDEEQIVLVSSRTGEGRDELLAALEGLLAGERTSAAGTDV